MNAKTYTSGCACGAVQLEISGDPAVSAYCHCNDCRAWLGAPVHAAALWPSNSVKVVKGADNLGMYKRTENSHRQFCRACGSGVLVRQRGWHATGQLYYDYGYLAGMLDGEAAEYTAEGLVQTRGEYRQGPGSGSAEHRFLPSPGRLPPRRSRAPQGARAT